MNGIVFSSYTNAYALYEGAKKLGVEIVTTDKHPIFPLRAQAFEINSDWLFFTEESSLKRGLRGELQGNFLPHYFSIKLLDNKWEFVEWLRGHSELTQGLKQWPLDCFDRVEFPCVLKAKHSWVDSVKLPRGWICRTSDEARENLGNLDSDKFEPDHFFFQEWLGDQECRIISVCGFHDFQDSSRNLTTVVKRVASHNSGLSCSAAVLTVTDEWGLVSRTNAILDRLEYKGPYELEYIVTGSRIVVLELNPRFWMQHSIFLKNGNGLLKRYLGMDTETDRQQKNIPPMMWIDGLHLVRTILSLRLGFPLLVLKQLILGNEKVLVWPSPPLAAYVWLRIIRNWLLQRLRLAA